MSNLERISKQLRNNAFHFDGERGLTIPKGNGKGLRPVVMAPIDNRVVRRAILEVLQGYGIDASPSKKRWFGVPAVRQVMETRTSVGGIKGRGVSHGLSLIDEAVRSGKHWFIRSDIRDFFTRIPLKEVNEFVASAVCDSQFAQTFAAALATNLTNMLDLKELNHAKLFPDENIGVAQGSALSPLAGNISLQQFDRLFNGRGIVCVRYIDDFIMLGASKASVQAAYRSAREHLKSLGMDAYDWTDEAARQKGKYDQGNIHDGTDVLGYRVSASSRQPSSAAMQSFKMKCDVIVEQAKKEMKLAASGQAAAYGLRYHQAMVLLHKTCRGWAQAFRHTTATHVFEALDKDVARRIDELRKFAHDLTRGSADDVCRRVMGIQPLADTLPHPLPPIERSNPSDLVNIDSAA